MASQRWPIAGVNDIAFKVYEVGGAVRDRLLGLAVAEHDWVVVGASPQTLIDQGYRPVGKDFPVFLHPQTGEEYALARTERKVAPGYQGFEFHATPEVTLEEDLARRDLTINAIARTPDGELIDPYNGQADLAARQLRHVSPAFREDPVRILRLARFAARFSPLGFTVADETLALCREMVAAGEVEALVPERVWQELSKALMMPAPQAFVQVLKDCGALAVIFPEIDRLFGIPQPVEHHPEIDTGAHTLLALAQSAALDGSLPARFATLVHDLGKGITPEAEWPRHRGHEAAGVPLVESLCDRLRVSGESRSLAIKVTRHHLECHRIQSLRPTTVLGILQGMDAFRRPERVDDFLTACEADYRGRLGLETRAYPQADYLREALKRCLAITAAPFIAKGLTGPAIGQAIDQARISALKALRAERA